jgi:hypothetical protein
VSQPLPVAALAWPVTSYVRALTYPGQASFLVRTVEWVRDNGGGVVDLLECGGARRRCRGRQDLRAEPR